SCLFVWLYLLICLLIVPCCALRLLAVICCLSCSQLTSLQVCSCSLSVSVCPSLSLRLSVSLRLCLSVHHQCSQLHNHSNQRPIRQSRPNSQKFHRFR